MVLPTPNNGVEPDDESVIDLETFSGVGRGASNISGSGMTISQLIADEALEVQSEARVSESDADLLAADPGRVYRTTNRIAAGGMGMILAARDMNIRRDVAMKVLLEENLDSDEHLLRFVNEARLTSQLEHPNIVPVHDIGVDETGNVFYTMKLVRGRTLASILDDLRAGKRLAVQRYSLTQLLNVLLKTCDALAFAHSKHVVHRDLKPANIMVGEFGEVMVMDWGLAKALKKGTEGTGRIGPGGAAVTARPIDQTKNDDPFETRDGQVMGTPAFMAPEQAVGDNHNVDERTDIYALGALLYNTLTLHAPVEGPELSNVLYRVANGDIPPPSTYNKADESALPEAEEGSPGQRRVTRAEDLEERARAVTRQHNRGDADRPQHLPHCPHNRVPDSLAAVAMQALAFDRSDRYTSVRDFQRDIEAYLHGFSTTAENAGFGRSLLLLVQRHRLQFTVAVAGLAAVLAVVVGLVAWLASERTRAERNEAQILTMTEQFKAEQEEQHELGMLSAPAYVARAGEHIGRSEWRPALAAVDEALALDPTSVPGWRLKAVAGSALMRFKDAHAALQAISELDPVHYSDNDRRWANVLIALEEQVGAPTIPPLEGWKRGCYEQLMALPAMHGSSEAYRHTYRLLVEESPDEWIPLLRSEQEVKALLDGNKVTGRDITYQNGALKLPADCRLVIPAIAEDVVLEANVKLDGHALYLATRCDRDNTHGILGVLMDGGSRFLLGEFVDKEWRSLDSGTLPPSEDGIVALRVWSIDDTVTLAVNGKTVARVHGERCREPGMIAFGARENSRAWFRDLRVKVVTKTATAPNTPDGAASPATVPLLPAGGGPTP